MNTQPALPLLIEPETLLDNLNNPRLLIIDLGSQERYRQGHIENAIFVPTAALMAGTLPATGKLPSVDQLAQLFSAIGLTTDKHVVVYDDEGGGWAGRFIWTLDVIGHAHYSYLNGGMVTWLNEGYPLSTVSTVPTPTLYKIDTLNHAPIADLDEILNDLNNFDTVIWDARSDDEYTGRRMTAQKVGHIPGAKHFEWTQCMDPRRFLRVADLVQTEATLKSLGISRDKKIITHCQSHHRSGFTYLIGKLLGFPRIKAYAGSWSEWGNHPHTPVEV